MRVKIWLIVCFLFLFFKNVSAGIDYGFGVGYIIENIYIDSEDVAETEKKVPLLDLSVGFDIKMPIVTIAVNSKADFFGMDLIRGNREFSLFLEPKSVLMVPIKFNTVSFSPSVGYGGIYKKKYIKDSYTIGKEPLVITKNSADYGMDLFDFIFGGSLSCNDWLHISFITGKEIKEFHSISMKLRTSHSERTVPYLSIYYTGGEETKFISIGLSYNR